MADIAAVLGFTLTELDAMPPHDLMRWHARALDRFKSMHQAKAR